MSTARSSPCPVCRERPVHYVVPLERGYRLAACVECWPELEQQLRSDGFEFDLVQRAS